MDYITYMVKVKSLINSNQRITNELKSQIISNRT